MSDLITVQGVVLSAMPVGEYDKRLVLLTRERGKITAFAKGARRQNSVLLAAANPFVFGTFTLYEGRSSYNLNQAEISHHFVQLAAEQPGIYYGYYFLELADYFGREGIDEREMMNLLYFTIKALLNPNIENSLIRCIFELRTMTIQGLMPELGSCTHCSREAKDEEAIYFSQEQHGIVCENCRKQITDARLISGSVLYAMRVITAAPINRLYTFNLSEEILRELKNLVHPYVQKNTDRKFKSLEILEIMQAV